MVTDQFIGIFDSGLGGLTVAQAIQELLPHETIVYLADNQRAPYGLQSAEDILRYSIELTARLQYHGAKMIVVACNTATSAAIDALRANFPPIPFVGMEPAVKPAAAQTRNGKIGILATRFTLQSERYHTLLDRFAKGAEVYSDPCIGLVSLIEKGHLDNPEIRLLLGRILTPMLEAGVDTVALGCTHYPLVKSMIERICGPAVEVINPAPAAAKQVEKLLTATSLMSIKKEYPPLHYFLSTGSGVELTRMVDTVNFGQRLISPLNKVFY